MEYGKTDPLCELQAEETEGNGFIQMNKILMPSPSSKLIYNTSRYCNYSYDVTMKQKWKPYRQRLPQTSKQTSHPRRHLQEIFVFSCSSESGKLFVKTRDPENILFYQNHLFSRLGYILDGLWVESFNCSFT